MKKLFRIYAVLALLVLTAVGVSAGERIPFDAQHFTFYNHDGWGADAPETGAIDAPFLIGEASGCPIGDTSCNAWAELGSYSKLYVKMEGCDGDGAPNGSNPRIFINRIENEGQFNADKSQAKCLVIPNDGTWAQDYYTREDDGTLVIDLTKIAKEYGFVHFHSIKGSAWNTQAIVSLIEVEKADAAQQIGWVNLLNNSDMEGSDVSSFAVAEDAVNVQGVQDATIQDGVGVNGSRALVVNSLAGATEDWATQLFVKLGQTLLEGTKWRFSMDVKADHGVDGIGSGSHGAPREYLAGGIIPAFNVTEDWTTVTAEGTIAADLADKLASIAFDLNKDRETANTFYFDNVKFEIYKFGTTVEFSNDVILLDFGFSTNIPELVKNSGAKRIFLPNDCAKVTVNGKDIAIYSVEGLEDGRLYIFLEEPVSNSSANVQVAFTNPAGDYHLVYTSGPNVDGDVANYNGPASYNQAVEENDGYPYDYVTPTMMKSNPEDGSFNLDNSVQFVITFDKEIDCAALVATANGQALSVSPASDFAKEVTLSGGSLPNGVTTIKLTKIYPKLRLDDSIFGEEEFTVNIGEVVIDPNDQPEVLIPVDNFNNCPGGQIPEGFQVNFNGSVLVPQESYGSGPRMFTFSEGGDFTRGLYFREGYVETIPGLELKAGKKYMVTFNTAMWKGSNTIDFRVLNSAEEVVLEQKGIECKPSVEGVQNIVVNGSNKSEIEVQVETDGTYFLRWVADGFREILLANVSVQYQPNVPGMKETLALQSAIEAAKTALEQNSGERYSGEAYNNLQSVIASYEGWKSTSPSAYKEAIDALNAAAAALKDHRALCDNYDTQVKKAIDVVRQNEMPNGDPEMATKFVQTELFAQLKAIVAKYNGTSEWQNLGTEEEPNWQLNYSFDILKEDAALNTAVAELTQIANTTSLLFTEGVSAPEGANGGKATGVAVLIDRLRQGADALKTLGVSESSPTIVAARAALTDDDAVAERIKTLIKQTVYGKLKEADNDLFKGVIDEATLETITPTYNMTVFVKNPNIYKQKAGTNFTDESVPGWTTPEGYNRPGLTVGWGADPGSDEVAVDCMFQTWGASYRVEQTITDLPAGIYTIKFGFGERNDEASNTDNYVYASSTDSGEMQTPATVIGQSFPFANNGLVIENVKVTDGLLTIGANAGSASHTFFNDVQVLLTAPAPGYNYQQAWADGIESVDTQKATVTSTETFDLSGRALSKAQRGVVIVKKHLSDGTVSTEKVVRK